MFPVFKNRTPIGCQDWWLFLLPSTSSLKQLVSSNFCGAPPIPFTPVLVFSNCQSKIPHIAWLQQRTFILFTTMDVRSSRPGHPLIGRIFPLWTLVSAFPCVQFPSLMRTLNQLGWGCYTLKRSSLRFTSKLNLQCNNTEMLWDWFLPGPKMQWCGEAG